jgi:hypothetical protein
MAVGEEGCVDADGVSDDPLDCKTTALDLGRDRLDNDPAPAILWEVQIGVMLSNAISTQRKGTKSFLWVGCFNVPAEASQVYAVARRISSSIS